MDYWPAKVCISGEELKLTGILCSSRGGGYSLIWPIRGCDVGQGMAFVLRVYNFYVSVVNRVCILSYVLNRDLKWIVLSYTGLVFGGGGAFFLS